MVVEERVLNLRLALKEPCELERSSGGEEEKSSAVARPFTDRIGDAIYRKKGEGGKRKRCEEEQKEKEKRINEQPSTLRRIRIPDAACESAVR